jgi:uncharacterized repeat protein (TIGR03803 family)
MPDKTPDFSPQRIRTLRPLPFLPTLLGAVLLAAIAAQGQTYTVLYSFNSSQGGNGYDPVAGVTLDRAGNLYGTTARGGFGTGCQPGCGVVYKLTHRGSSWLFAPLYSFHGLSDGAMPFSRPVIGPDGTLYGTTFLGGNGCSGECGVVYNLRPPAHASPSLLTSWTQTVLYSFFGVNDGQNPGSGDLIFDSAGNLYGTTSEGGGGFCTGQGCGTVYELTHSHSGWSENILHAFSEVGDGALPYGGLIFDPAGNLYGMTVAGGLHNRGMVYQLTPSGMGWSEHQVYVLDGGTTGDGPYSTPVLDQAGNLYGTACCGGPTGGGTVFQLTHSQNWTLNMLHTFSGQMVQGPQSGLVMDSAGNLYGTTNQEGAYGYGSVFKLTPQNGGWSFTSLHDFCVGGQTCTDGANPAGTLELDAAGNLYGTATTGGVNGGGVVFEITPQ